MDLESDNHSDILLTKLLSTLKKSNNTLHKKSIILVQSLHTKLDPKQLVGVQGWSWYTKHWIDFLLKFKAQKVWNDDDVLNYEAIIFTLAVCWKQLPYDTLKHPGFIARIKQIIEFSLSQGLIGNYISMKYSVMILEKILFSRSHEELLNNNDEIVKFYISNTIKLLIYAFGNNNSSASNLQGDWIKSICKWIRDKVNSVKYTVLKSIMEFLKIKIQKMKDIQVKSSVENERDSDTDEDKQNIIPMSNLIQTIPWNEGENIWKFLSSLIQFLPFDMVNDIIFELYNLITSTETKVIWVNSFLCVDVAFSTKSFTWETSEKFIKWLLTKEILLNDAVMSSGTNSDFKDKFVVAYIKSITQVWISINKINQIQSLKYFIGILSWFSEWWVDDNEFVKGNIYNSLQNLINKLFDKKGVDQWFAPINKANEDINIEDITIENDSNKIDGYFILEKVSKVLLYLLSSRYSDNKVGYNWWWLFLEKINCSGYKDNIRGINENVFLHLSENESLRRSEMLKIFIGKCFNYIPCSLIIQYFPLGILDYDISKDDYTESSNVWIISFMDKFLREGTQTLNDYVTCFMNDINEIEYYISKWKTSKNTNNANDMAVEEDDADNDERIAVDGTDSKYIREVKIKRYELILTQLITQIMKFTNWCDGYDKYIWAFLQKFEVYFKNEKDCYFQGLKDLTFRFWYKVIVISMKKNDLLSLEVIRANGSFFFQKILNLILSNKLNKSELQEGFNVVSKFCVLWKEDNIFKIILDMIDKFNVVIDSGIFNNQTPNNNSNVTNKKNIINTNGQIPGVKGATDNEKEIKKWWMRLEIINYMLKNISATLSPDQINAVNKTTNVSTLMSIVFGFFDKYFFTFARSNNPNQLLLSKRFFDIFITVVHKINDNDYVYQVFTSFMNKNGWDTISPKQKCKVFEHLVSIIISKFTPLTTVTMQQIQNQFTIWIELSGLTKDMNRKVRNSSYEIIGNLTRFFTEKKLFNDWVKYVISLFSSNSPFIKSSAVNTLARVFWENRNEETAAHNVVEVSELVFLFFKENNKELLKSLFIFIRVLLFIIKAQPNNMKIINRVLHCSLNEINDSMHKEFKVKIRNLIKNLILNFGYDVIRASTPEKFLQLVQYINKHLVKKINNRNKEEELLHGYNKAELDDSVMLDNEENLIDEEEEYIKREFKKIDKRDDKEKEWKIVDKIERMNLYDDDIEDVQKHERETVAVKDKKADKLDKIQEWFVKDNVELNNFFYVNPYVTSNTTNQVNNKTEPGDEKDLKDVLYDTKKGKFIVKDWEKEIEDSKLAKKRKKQQALANDNIGIDDMKDNHPWNMWKKKRVQNVNKDKDEIDVGDSDEDDKKYKKKKMKINENLGQTVKHKNMGTHYVKYSGDQYKNKSGKGDKIIKGQYDPVAYIQWNPKALSVKGSRDNAKIFEKLMKNDNKK